MAHTTTSSVGLYGRYLAYNQRSGFLMQILHQPWSQISGVSLTREMLITLEKQERRNLAASWRTWPKVQR